MSDKSIPFVVDDAESSIKSSRSPLEHFIASRASKVIDLELKTLAAQVNERIADLNDALSELDTSAGLYEVDTISLTMAITSTGKVAILSTIEGSASPQVGLLFTLKKRQGIPHAQSLKST